MLRIIPKILTYSFTLLSGAAFAQVIDTHLHAFTEATYRSSGDHPLGGSSPETAAEHLRMTIEEMDRNDVRHAVVSGSLESVEQWVAADARFIPGYQVTGTSERALIEPEVFEQLVREGKFRVLGEFAPIFAGKTLADPLYAPYLEISERLGVPVAYHSGGTPPMAPMTCCPEARIALGDPLLIEDVLVRYPRLKIYLMHAGEAFHRNALSIMMVYRHVYVDLGVMLWANPYLQDNAEEFLRNAKRAGVLNRVMYGSDQMAWPGSISASIEYLNSLSFLDDNDRRMILHDNAARFFGLDTGDDERGTR